ncbi:MAG: hypothetical protein H6835_10705 [Planctomycetes bacterium]|nr:hypothetical protein [Planctomycetota bacterium]
MQPRFSLFPVLLAASFASAQEDVPKPRNAPAEVFRAQATALSPELGKAAAKAQMHNKNVLVLFPEEGQDLAAMLKKDRALSRPLLYEVEMASVSREAAAKAAKCWGVAGDRPAAVMLDKRGTVLERLGAADLVVDGKVPGADLLKKLEPKWATPVDAEQKLTAALAEAKKAGRNVFIRFDAPW